MAVELKMKAIIPKKGLSPRTARGYLLRALEDTSKDLQKTFEMTTQTFRNHPVDFTTDPPRYAGGNITIAVYTESDIYYYLDHGTKERWAVVSPNWTSKTWPGRFLPTSGSGFVRVRGKRRMTALGLIPNRGIEGRHWTTMINRMYKDILFNRVYQAVIKGIGKP